MKAMKHIHFLRLFLASTMLLGLFETRLSAQTLPSSTEGNDFWGVFMDNNSILNTDASLELTIYIVADTSIDVYVEGYNNKKKNLTITDPQGGMTSYVIKSTGTTPAASGVYIDNPKSNSEKAVSKYFHIYNKDAKDTRVFRCYAVNKVGASGSVSQDATLLMPKQTYGKEYIIQTFENDTKSTQFSVTALEAGTEVTITPSAKTLNGKAANTPFTVKLGKGQSVLVPSQTRVSAGQSGRIDLSGSLVCANKPVAVFSGNQAPKIPFDNALSIGHAVEQILPITKAGKEFYLALLNGTMKNKYNVVSLYSNTTVKLTYGYADGTSTNETITLTDIGDMFTTDARTTLSDKGVVDVHIQANQPIMCRQFLTSGGENQEEQGMTTIRWGNPADADVISWNARVQSTRIITKKMITESGQEQKHYVAFIVPTAEIGLLTITDQKGNPVTVNPSDFTPFKGNSAMSHGSVLLSTSAADNWYDIRTTGTGFVGSVYGITNGIAYQYTLDFNPYTDRDSLFISNTGVMSPTSYELPYITKKGYYQRQFGDWLSTTVARLDTAYICNGRSLDFVGQVPSTINLDSVVWQIYQCNDKGSILLDKMIDSKHITTPTASQYKFSHKFEQQDETNRSPYTFYQTQILFYRKHILCEDLPDYVDTLRTMVRVYRAYNDTVWKMACTTDTIKFFYDDPTHKEAFGDNLDSTVFFYKAAKKTYQQPFEIGANKWTRKYNPSLGCDSTITLMLYVCEGATIKLDTTICSNHPLTFPGSSFFQGQRLTKTGVYRDTIHSHRCDEMKAMYDPKNQFPGCDSILEVHLTVLPAYDTTMYDTICVSEAITKYDWVRPKKGGGTYIAHTYSIPLPPKDTVYRFYDSLLTVQGCDSIWRMNLYVSPHIDQKDNLTMCDNELLNWHGIIYVGDQYLGERPAGCKIAKAGQTYKDTYKASHTGCENEYELTLKVNKSYFIEKGETYSLCQEEEWKWHGNEVIMKTIDGRAVSLDTITNSSGHYILYDSLKTVNQCDSVYQLDITIHPSYVGKRAIIVSETICSMKLPYKWQGHINPATGKVWELNATGEYTDTITTMIGHCDSVVILNLEVIENILPDWDKDTTVCRTRTTAVTYDKISFTPSKMPKNVEDTVFLAIKEYGSVCDFYERLRVHICPAASVTVKDTVCRDTVNFWTWEGHTEPNHRVYSKSGSKLTPIDPTQIPINVSQTTAFTYVDSIRTDCACECDSIVTLNLVVIPSYYGEEEKSISNEGYIIWEGMTFMGERCTHIPTTDSVIIVTNPYNKFYYHHETQPIGTHICDSTRALILRADVLHRDTTYDFVCENCQYIWSKPQQDGTTKDTVIYGKDIVGDYQCFSAVLKSYKGLDSTFVLNLYKSPVYHMEPQKDVACIGSTYFWEGHERNWIWDETHQKLVSRISTDEVGEFTYIDTLETKAYFIDPHRRYTRMTRCDSICTLTIQILPTSRTLDAEEQICDVDTIRWRNRIYAGNYFNNIPLLEQMKAEHQIDTFLICSEGWHQDSVAVPSVLTGCDSVLIFSLDVNGADRLHFHHIIGDNDTTSWSFCPSQDWTRDSCQTAWDLNHGIDYSIPNRSDRRYIFMDSTVNILGCDSMVWDTLDIFPTYRFIESDTTCSDSRYTWRGKDYLNEQASDGWHTFYDSLVTHDHGLDSVYVLKLYIVGVVNTYEEKEMCKNDTLMWFGQIISYDESIGDRIHYESVFHGAYGCEGSRKLDVNFHDFYHFEEDTTICPTEGLWWHGRYLSEEGEYWDSLKTVTCQQCKTGGCDSIYHLVLHNSPIYTSITMDTVCQNTDDKEYIWIDKDKRPGVIVDYDQGPILIDKVGTFRYEQHFTPQSEYCDSVFILNLVVLPTYKQDTTLSLCDNDSIHFADKIYIGNKSPWAGAEHTYPVGQYNHIDTIYEQTTAGCDSLIIVSLIVYPTYSEITDLDTICDNEQLVIGGIVYNAHGEWVGQSHVEIRDTLPSVHGCDSAVYHFITIYPTYSFPTKDTVCSNESYTWSFNHQTYTGLIAGDTTFSQPYLTQHGCDSIYTLKLHVNPAYYFPKDSTIETSKDFTFNWHHISLLIPYDTETDTTRYTFHDSTTTVTTHCDSIYRLDLTVIAVRKDTIYDTICTGDKYYFEDEIITRGGIYSHKHGTAIKTLVLEEIAPTKVSVQGVDVCADANQMKITFAFQGKRPKTFRIDYEDAAEKQGFADQDRIPVTDDTLYINMPYRAVKENYIRPDKYGAQLFFEGVCIDSTLIKEHVAFVVRYPNWIIPQHWNDAINILVDSLNGGYQFEAYQWRKNGDPIIGSTLPYFYDPHYLDALATYSVDLKRVGEDYYICTCEMTPNIQGIDPVMPTTPYCAVVPTSVPKENPVVNILSVSGGEYELFNDYGSLYSSGSYSDLDHNAYQVRMPGAPGVYIFRLYDKGAGEREVKVMVY